MVIVIASITIKPGKVDEFIAAFKDNLPAVHAEKGCIEYFPSQDIDSGMPVQELNENVVTICEKWESLEHLAAHGKAPHMLAYRERVKELVEGMTLKVLQQA